MQNEYEIKKEMCEIGKRVYNRGMVAANDGNFSVRISENEVLCTPTGVSKGFMTPDYICKVDLTETYFRQTKDSDLLLKLKCTYVYTKRDRT